MCVVGIGVYKFDRVLCKVIWKCIQFGEDNLTRKILEDHTHS